MFSIAKYLSWQAPSQGVSDMGLTSPPVVRNLDGLQEGLLVAGGLLFVAVIALVDCRTRPYLSCGIFYLIPVAASAWWGGTLHGILLALAGSIAWYAVDALENPLLLPAAQGFNGAARFGILALTSSLISLLHASILRERLLARTDPLTGAANNRTFYEAATTEVERTRRMAQPLTLAYLDLDNFKQLNDRLGHAAGDAVLIQVVRTIRANLRRTDFLARLGGDEFGLLLPETDGEGATALLNRLHERLSQELARSGWPVAVSVGAITFYRPSLDVDQLIHQVDALMYQAKGKGKGRVEYAVVPDGQESPRADRPGIERRATPGGLCSRTVRIRREGQAEDPERFATICDISARGAEQQQENQYLPGTVFIIGPCPPVSSAHFASATLLFHGFSPLLVGDEVTRCPA